MKRVFVAALAAFFVLFVYSKSAHTGAVMAVDERAGPTVYVAIGDIGSHGSGVHIGDGYVLTAAHVADSGDTGKDAVLTVEDDRGNKHAVEVLWVNHKYDLALLKITDYVDVKSAPLSCRSLVKGEHVTAEGNPLQLRNITTHGQVASTEMTVSAWARANVIEAALGPGMSGGPVYDADGFVVGINVGVPIEMIGYNPAPAPFYIIVPAAAACNLMGR